MQIYNQAVDEFDKETNPLRARNKNMSKKRSKGPIKKFPSSDVNKLSRASEVLQLDKDTYDPEANDSEPTIAVGTEGKGLESQVGSIKGKLPESAAE